VYLPIYIFPALIIVIEQIVTLVGNHIWHISLYMPDIASTVKGSIRAKMPIHVNFCAYIRESCLCNVTLTQFQND
jgi:hypothetical protein